MANELNIALAQSQTGLSVTAQRYQGGVVVGAPIALTEVGGSGYYTGNMTGAAGDYDIVFRSAGENVGSGRIRWDGSTEILPATGGSIPTADISAIRAKTDALNTTRLANVATVETTGAQIAAALS